MQSIVQMRTSRDEDEGESSNVSVLFHCTIGDMKYDINLRRLPGLSSAAKSEDEEKRKRVI